MICWKCKKEIGELQVSRTTECPECRADLHVCKACKFYAPGSHYDCKETLEDPVSDKERGNFCDFFKYKAVSGTGEADNKAAAARNAFDALFG